MADAPTDAEIDTVDASDATPARESANGPYAKLAVSGAHNQQEVEQGSTSQLQDSNHDHQPQNRYHHQHSQHTFPHPHHHSHHHRTASRQTPAYEASDASTPTRTRSTSSSTFTPLSTFPSSTSRAHPIGDNLEILTNIDNLDNIDTRNPYNSIVRAEHVQVTGGADTRDIHDYINTTEPDHVPFAQLHSYYPSSQHQQQQQQPSQTTNGFLTLPLPQPHSLLASPQLGIGSRVRRRGTAGASRGSASQSRSRNHSHSRRTSLEENNTQDTTHRSVNDDNNTNEDQEGLGSGGDNDADDNDDAAESVDSHALAWDQTCLRIAYLVSTMVTPSANASVGGGIDADGRASETLAAARNDSQSANGGEGPSDSASNHKDMTSNEASHSNVPGFLDTFVERCNKGWSGSDPTKKRRKIAQIMHWQSEVLAFSKTVYCGCANGSPIPDDSLFAAAAPTAAAPPAQSANAAAAGNGSCGHCGYPLTPKRPVVWVSDPRDHNDEDVFKKVRRSQEGAGDSLRKAFKSIRGFVLNKKNKRSVSTPATTTAAAVAGTSTVPSPPTRTPPAQPSASPATANAAASAVLDKPTTCRRAWSQWDEINTENLRNTSEEMKALFFPQTDMYHVQVDGSEASNTVQGVKLSGLSSPQSKKPDDATHESKGKNVVDQRGGDGHDEDDEDYDPDEADSQGELNTLHETQARLRRAERLLQKNVVAAAQTAGN
ncbi:hypothetical protein SBRCBS47491_006920 [Sporothrix bragantina]|uniref:Uncharacterized protein n=1 Tax=Sporothrix bragantina TaxID=671064 RepID=A0ABP0CB62_9PEZI